MKCEIVVEALSGVLIDTVRDRDKEPWLFKLEDEALCAEACCAAAWAACLAAALAAALAEASACALKAASAACLAAAAALLPDAFDDELEDEAELDVLEITLDAPELPLLMVTLPVASKL